ncbi:hypothetical protein VTL71DRAFT_5485 [Oculimacula yallundae]|uniref:C2H2-type domain-containing protein n=1 Tax=Oculimacula yallundae TaxID=86028 RepID=A0ABR4C1B0_9HELO
MPALFGEDMDLPFSTSSSPAHARTIKPALTDKIVESPVTSSSSLASGSSKEPALFEKNLGAPFPTSKSLASAGAQKLALRGKIAEAPTWSSASAASGGFDKPALPSKTKEIPASPSISSSSSVDLVFSPQHQSSDASSETDLDDVQYPGSHHSDVVVSYEDHALSVLEAHLCALLDDNLPLLAKLVPEVFYATRASLRYARRVENAKTLPSSEEPRDTTGGSSGSASASSTPKPLSNKRAASSQTGSCKRVCDMDEADETKEILQKDSDIHGQCQVKRFAHMHVTIISWIQQLINRKPIADITATLIYDRDHFQATHGPFYCDSCDRTFETDDLLFEHCGKRNCASISSNRVKGISGEQWKSICSLVKANRGLTGEDKERHEIDRWYDIWEVLNPGIAKPNHPFTDVPGSDLPRPLQLGSLLEVFQRIIQSDMETGVLRADDHVHQHYLHAFEETYNMAFLETPGITGSISFGNTGTEQVYQAHEASPGSSNANEQILGLLPDHITTSGTARRAIELLSCQPESMTRQNIALARSERSLSFAEPTGIVWPSATEALFTVPNESLVQGGSNLSESQIFEESGQPPIDLQDGSPISSDLGFNLGFHEEFNEWIPDWDKDLD